VLLVVLPVLLVVLLVLVLPLLLEYQTDLHLLLPLRD
jgi:hypothetical protein